MSEQSYKIKEVYYTLQGEGAHTGRPAVFVRFTGCNLWSGREEDRSTAICRFCDTDFWGMDGDHGGKYTAEALLACVLSLWPVANTHPYVVCTGGEPMLQLDSPLIAAFHRGGCEIAIETNGTIAVPEAVDWICVSPKAGTELVQRQGDELKLVFQQQHLDPGQFMTWDFKHFFLQPMDGPDLASHTHAAIDYCRTHPQWKLSVQTHKLLGLP